MMMNKILVTLYVPMIDKEYDVFIPANEYIWRINKLLVKALSDLSDGTLPMDKNYVIANIDTGKIYEKNSIVINTDIRNSTKLVLFDV